MTLRERTDRASKKSVYENSKQRLISKALDKLGAKADQGFSRYTTYLENLLDRDSILLMEGASQNEEFLSLFREDLRAADKSILFVKTRTKYNNSGAMISCEIDVSW